MSTFVQRGRRGAGRPLPTFPLLLVPAALAFGALYAISAYSLSPTTVPELIVLALVVGVGYRHAELGIAATLVIIPAGTFGLNQQRVAYAVSGVSVYLALMAYRQRRAAYGRVQVPGIGTLVLLYVCAALVSVTQATQLSPASHLIRSLVTDALLFAATVLSVRDRRSLMLVLAGVAAGALVVGAHATVDYVSGASTSSGFVTSSGQIVGRVSAGFSQPNQLGGFLVVLAPLAIVGAALARRWRSVFAAAALLSAIGVYASFSRGALIGLVLVPFVFLRGWRLWLVGPAVAIVTLIAAPGLVRERFATLSSSGPDVSTRVDIWGAAVNIWERHPIFGVGIGGFPEAYAQAPIPGKLFLPGSTFEPPPHAHNVFLQILAEEGILGFLTLVAVVIAAVRVTLRLRAGPDRAVRLLGSGLLAALLAFLVHNMFDVTLEDPQTGPYVLVLIGVIAACGVVFAPPSDRRNQI